MISNFRGKYAAFSNFSDCHLFYNGRWYDSTEAAFQAAKTLNDSEQYRISLMTPNAAKKAGRSVELRPDWEQVKVGVMRDLIDLKFTKGGDAAELLDSTGDDIIIEGTTWHDKYWGVCTCSKCGGKGANVLGQILMNKRAKNRGLPEKPIDECPRVWITP